MADRVLYNGLGQYGEALSAAEEAVEYGARALGVRPRSPAVLSGGETADDLY